MWLFLLLLASPSWPHDPISVSVSRPDGKTVSGKLKSDGTLTWAVGLFSKSSVQISPDYYSQLSMVLHPQAKPEFQGKIVALSTPPLVNLVDSRGSPELASIQLQVRRYEMQFVAGMSVGGLNERWQPVDLKSIHVGNQSYFSTTPPFQRHIATRSNYVKDREGNRAGVFVFSQKQNTGLFAYKTDVQNYIVGARDDIPLYQFPMNEMFSHQYGDTGIDSGEIPTQLMRQRYPLNQSVAPGLVGDASPEWIDAFSGATKLSPKSIARAQGVIQTVVSQIYKESAVLGLAVPGGAPGQTVDLPPQDGCAVLAAKRMLRAIRRLPSRG